MKKVLILSYYYPPANFAGSYRIKAWAEELTKIGYEVTVVTRHWEKNCTDYTAISPRNIVEKDNEQGITVYRVPYKGTWRDKLIQKNFNFFGFEKILSLFNLLASLYILKFNPAFGLYLQTKKIIKQDNTIQTIITSGRPFYQFQFLYRLKKQFPQLRCIGDYRDPWNTNTNINQSLKRRFFCELEKPIEIKTTSNFEFLTTCSEGFKSNVQSLITNIPVHIITNGFKEFYTSQNEIVFNSKFEIAFIGSLYENQKIEVFLRPLVNFIHAKKIKLIFYGLLNQPDQVTRIEKIVANSDLEVYFESWIDKKSLVNRVKKHNAFLLCGLKSQKGRHTAKFFDYLSFQKNIILCPSDEDVLAEEIKRLNVGVILDDENNVNEWLNELHENKYIWKYNGLVDTVAEFKYTNQVKKLSNHIENMT